jgi:hypothetical protein
MSRHFSSIKYLLLVPVFFNFSCASGPKSQPLIFDTARIASVSSAGPGSLLEAESLEVIPSSKTQLLLAMATPFLLGVEIKMDALKEEGYADWRMSRLNNLSDLQSMRIIFTARLPEGGSERQSGTIFLPTVPSGQTRVLTWVIFEKGTELRRDNTPSRGKGLEMPFITAIAALGYAVWVPDYTGMGDGLGAHEYCVAESLADSALDGLTAARYWLGNVKEAGRQVYQESGRLAIIGYSEGGLAAMGTLKAIAEGRLPTPGLRLIAVYPMGAPLNLGIVIPDIGPGPYLLNHAEYQVFLALGWVRAYPKKLKLSDILSPETIKRIVPLYDGTKSDVDVGKRIAAIVGKEVDSITDVDIFKPKYLIALRQDPASTAYYRLQTETRLDRWTPPLGVPIILAATPTDDIVPFANTWNEYDWAKHNAPKADVTLVELSTATHIIAGAEAFLYAMVDFDKRETELAESAAD